MQKDLHFDCLLHRQCSREAPCSLDCDSSPEYWNKVESYLKAACSTSPPKRRSSSRSSSKSKPKVGKDKEGVPPSRPLGSSEKLMVDLVEPTSLGSDPVKPSSIISMRTTSNETTGREFPFGSIEEKAYEKDQSSVRKKKKNTDRAQSVVSVDVETNPIEANSEVKEIMSKTRCESYNPKDRRCPEDKANANEVSGVFRDKV